MTKYICFFYAIFNCFTAFSEALTEHEVVKAMQCYRDQMAKIADPQEKYNFALRSIPDDELYKLFIDKKRLANPKENEKNSPAHLLFDVEEPGYFNAMYNTFKALPKYIGKDVDLAMSVELHDKAVDGVTRLNRVTKAQDPFWKGIAIKEFFFGIPITGGPSIEELVDSAILFDGEALAKLLRPNVSDNSSLDLFIKTHFLNKFMAQQKLHGEQGNVIESILHTEQEWKELFQPIFDHFHRNIRQSKSLDGVLAATAELLRALEVSHLLPDGNTRTNAFLLMNKILIENNLVPVILDDTGMLGGYLTVQELTQKIRAGMTNFLNEKPEFHRSFVNNQCADIILDDEWLNTNDYVPYYSEATPLHNVAEGFLNVARNKVEASIANGPNALSEEFFGDHSPLYFAILLGQTDWIEKLLSSGAKVNVATEYYPIHQSLLLNKAMVPTILLHYRKIGVSEEAKKDLLEAALMLLGKKDNLSLEQKKYLQEINALMDHTDPFIQLLFGDVEAFKANMLENPSILFKKTPRSGTILKYFYRNFSKNNNEIWGEILETLFKAAPTLTKDQTQVIFDLLLAAIRKFDEQTIDSFLRIDTLNKLVQDQNQAKRVEREKNPFNALVEAFSKQLRTGISSPDQFKRVFDLLKAHGASPPLTFRKGANLLHRLIRNAPLIGVLNKILVNEELTEKALTFNTAVDKIIVVAEYLIDNGVEKNQKNREEKTPFDLASEAKEAINDRLGRAKKISNKEEFLSKMRDLETLLR